jgi:hypothetical protein
LANAPSPESSKAFFSENLDITLLDAREQEKLRIALGLL